MKGEIKRIDAKIQQFDGQILDKKQMTQLKGGNDSIGIQDIIDG